MKRVLLTGASGFVGRHAIDPLRKLGYEIHATTSIARPAVDGVFWHVADLLASGSAREIIERVRPSHMLHIAWYAEPGKYWQSPINLQWVSASLELLRAFGETGGRRVVMVGTCAEYDWTDGHCVEFDTPRHPQTLYGSCKNALAQMLEAYARQAGFSSAWARLFFMYGPGEPRARLVPSVITSLLDGKAADCTHGQQVRDFLHVEDVANALAALLHSEVQGPVNISSGEPIALRDVVNEIARQLRRPDLVRLGALPTPASDPPLIIGDCTRLRNAVGWRPSHTLSEGMANTIGWWSAQTDRKPA